MYVNYKYNNSHFQQLYNTMLCTIVDGTVNNRMTQTRNNEIWLRSRFGKGRFLPQISSSSDEIF